MKKIKIVAVALLLAITVGIAYGGTTVQKASYNLPNGTAYSLIGGPSVPAKAEFEGNMQTKDGKMSLGPLNGRLTLDDQDYSLQLKPSTSEWIIIKGGPGCNVVCHITTTPVQTKYEGPGSSVRDGAGVLYTQEVQNLPVPPANRMVTSLYSIVVSKDQAYQLSLWGRDTPTIK